MSEAGNGVYNLRFEFSDGSRSCVGIGTGDIDKLISQLDDALADGHFVFAAPNGRRFVCKPDAMRAIRTLLLSISRGDSNGASRTGIAGATPPTAVFSSEKNLRSFPVKFCSKSRGGSDAQVVDGSSIEQLSQIQASAPSASPAKSSDSSTEDGDVVTARYFNSPKKRGCREENAGSKSPVAATAPFSQKEYSAIIGDEVRNAIQPLLVELDSIIALANENLAAIKQFSQISGAVSAARQKSRAVALSARGDNLSRCRGAKAHRADSDKSIAKDSPKMSGGASKGNSLPIKTQNGRTSVVVGTRRVK